MKNIDYGPCYPCTEISCTGCKHALMCDWVTLFENMPASQEEKDRYLEKLWQENDSILWEEDKDGRLCLAQPFHGFPVGEFNQDDWFRFIDEHHSKGVGWVYENIN